MALHPLKRMQTVEFGEYAAVRRLNEVPQPRSSDLPPLEDFTAVVGGFRWWLFGASHAGVVVSQSVVIDVEMDCKAAGRNEHWPRPLLIATFKDLTQSW